RWKLYGTIQAMLRQHNPDVLRQAAQRGWDGVLDQDMISYLHGGRNPEWNVKIFALGTPTLMNDFNVEWESENLFVCVRIDLSYAPVLHIQYGVLTLHHRPDMRMVKWCGIT